MPRLDKQPLCQLSNEQIIFAVEMNGEHKEQNGKMPLALSREANNHLQVPGQGIGK